MNLIDLLDDSHDGYQARTFAEERERRHGVTEDDDSVIAASLYIMPEESEHEGGSPLNFGTDGRRSAGSYFRSLEKKWAREERAMRRRVSTMADELTFR